MQKNSVYMPLQATIRRMLRRWIPGNRGRWLWLRVLCYKTHAGLHRLGLDTTDKVSRM